MKNKIVRVIFSTLIILTLGACAARYVPLHTPENLSNISTYKRIPKANIHEEAPYPDGTPNYLIVVETGTSVGPNSGVVYHNYLYPRTNADTSGLTLLKDGSKTYDVKIARYNEAAGAGSLVLSIESEASLARKQAEENRVINEAAAAKSEQLKNERKLLREKHCSDFSRAGYFCFDDNNKLANHDIDAVSRLLRDITQKIVVDKQLYDYDSVNSIVAGQWYVESATDKSISITITRAAKPLGETVIDRQVKAGKPFYIVRKDSTEFFK